jgi:hypothetical protein
LQVVVVLISQSAVLTRLGLSPPSALALAVGWASAAVVFVAMATLAGDGGALRDWLGDPDDALRLLSVRALLEGAPWFDPTLPRVGAPDPLISHWSRLIDLPLAALIGILRPLLGQDLGELLTRMFWPLALFAFLQVLVVREAHRRGGAWAAACAAVFAATSIAAMGQFRPGRIDHHNAQILCAVAGLLLLVRAIDEHRQGWRAGVLFGLGLAIGYEAIALVVPALGLAALIAQVNPAQRRAILSAVTATTGTLLVAFLLTLPPLRWVKSNCDALSLNMLVLAGCCSLGLWAAHRFAVALYKRLAILGVAATAGAAIFAALEPSCLAGPFGQVDPALKSIWLDHVLETKSLLWLSSRQPALALAQFVFLFAGAGAQIALWRRRCDAASTLATGIVLLAVALGCWQMKLVPYATWLTLLPLAVFCAGLAGTALVSAPLVRITALVLLSQATLAGALSLAGASLPQAAARAAAAASFDPRRACFQSASLRRLGALGAGLVAADIDLGPYIVALTPHRVVAAPYHRLSQGILANRAILDGPLHGAEPAMRALGVDYIALCNVPTDAVDGAGQSLRQQLLGGRSVDFLQELTAGADAPLRIWQRTIP